MGKAGGKTTPSQFRLSDDVLTALDRIAAKLSEDGVPHSRTDAVRKSVSIAAKSLGVAGIAEAAGDASANIPTQPAEPPKKPRKK